MTKAADTSIISGLFITPPLVPLDHWSTKRDWFDALGVLDSLMTGITVYYLKVFFRIPHTQTTSRSK